MPARLQLSRRAVLALPLLLITAGPLVAGKCAGADPATAAAEVKPHNFERWEKAIAAFEAADRTSPPPRHAVLFVGSSTIGRWKTLAQDFPTHHVINRGFGGSEIVDATYFADRIVIPYEPAVVIFRSGSNDLAAGKSPEQVFADYQAFVAKVHARLPETEIVYLSWNPTQARWRIADQHKTLNMLVESFTRKTPHLKYIETWDLPLGPDGMPREELFVADKLHFNAEGYKLLAERVRAYLATVPDRAQPQEK